MCLNLSRLEAEAKVEELETKSASVGKGSVENDAKLGEGHPNVEKEVITSVMNS